MIGGKIEVFLFVCACPCEYKRLNGENEQEKKVREASTIESHTLKLYRGALN